MGKETECAPYEVVQSWKDENVELRRYPARKWVATSATAAKMSDVMSSSFFKLFRYIQGTNVPHQKVQMTKPVLVENRPVADSMNQRIITTSFFIPDIFQSDPPTPTEDGVFILERDTMLVYARTYGGFSSDSKAQENVRQLCIALDALGKQFHPNPYFFAGYDPPFKLIGRTNDVFLIAKNA